ncbi:MAG: YkgJ family cysteine cluster protein [Candidatus Bathyarchaeota archaeon]
MSSISRESNFFEVCESCELPCCKGARPPLSRVRITIIQKYLRAEGFSLKTPFNRSGYSFPREISGGYCIFFDLKTKRCTIHPSKPETCVAGPVTFDLDVKKGIIEWYLKSEKICRLAGSLYQNKPKLSKHLESAKREIRALINSLSGKELLAILRIDEPDTFKIGEELLEDCVLRKFRSVTQVL